MHITKVVIKNYRCFSELILELNENLNIIVGDNSSGKSTLLEAIDLCLTGKLNNNSILNEISSSIFNRDAEQAYIEAVKENKCTQPPEILIELYFDNSASNAIYSGLNYGDKKAGQKKEALPGMSLRLYVDEAILMSNLQNYLALGDITCIPSEFYYSEWQYFSGNKILNGRDVALKNFFVNSIEYKFKGNIQKYISDHIQDVLNDSERSQHSVKYRETISKFKIENSKGEAQTVNIYANAEVAIDPGTKDSWTKLLNIFVENLPFHLIGKGEQNMIKLKLALRQNVENKKLVLVEEPENNLSHVNLHRMLQIINEGCKDKQLIITTHSTFVFNKLGINSTFLINKNFSTSFTALPIDTQEYFRKLPGYDTLRLTLAKKMILVEGPTDELLIQKAYKVKTGKFPANDGIDILSIKGTTFPRFLDIAKLMKNNKVYVLTDNDGEIEKLNTKYAPYIQDNIKLYWDSDDINCKTIETSFAMVNSVEVLRKILSKPQESTKEEIIDWMINKNNKTTWSLQLFDSDIENIIFPEHVNRLVDDLIQ